jgi:hypothetical protein
MSRSLRYRERAKECRNIASLAKDARIRAEYEKLATFYDEIAGAELKLANASNQN